MTLLLPLMGFLFVSLLVTAIGLVMARGETAIERRLGELGVGGSLPPVPSVSNERMLNMLKRVGKAAPKSASELGKLRQRLVASGYRGSEALPVFFGIRLTLALGLFGAVTTGLVVKPNMPLALGGAAIGWVLPGMALARMAKRRQHRIRLSLPDALDLLVVSVEAGISTLFLTFVRAGDVIVHSGPLYAATETIIAKILSQFGVKYVDFPAGATREEIDDVLARAKAMGNVSLIYLESPGNPTNALVDVEAIRDARAAAFAADALPPIAIDNTLLGPLWARPLDQGADISVYSLTKYAGGHSDLIAGALTGNKKMLDRVRSVRNTMGGIIDSHTAWMLLRSLETLELRMTRAGENAEKVCAFFKDHPKVETVGYLGFLEPGSRQKDIFDRHCLGAGSTFSLYLKGGEREAFAFLDGLKIAKLAVSLGGTETLASAPAAMTHLSVPDERKAALGISDNLVRISIGVEKAEDLIADFENALRGV